MRRSVLSPWIAALLVSCLALSGCALPTSSVRSVDESPALVVENAPEGAMLVVDGLEAGEANAYSGLHSLSVRPGRHVVEVRGDGEVLLKQDV